MKKKIFSLISILCLLTVFAIPVSALDNDFRMPRAPICTYCGNGTLHTSVSYGTLIRDGSYSCIHYPRGYDEKNYRFKTETIQCNYCGYGDSYRTKEYSRGTCHGFY